jgi:hypothetical protein
MAKGRTVPGAARAKSAAVTGFAEPRIAGAIEGFDGIEIHASVAGNDREHVPFGLPVHLKHEKDAFGCVCDGVTAHGADDLRRALRRVVDELVPCAPAVEEG